LLLVHVLWGHIQFAVAGSENLLFEQVSIGLAGCRERGSKRPSLHSEFPIVLVYTLLWRHQCAEVLSWATDAFAEATLFHANTLIMEDGLTWTIKASSTIRKLT
jgi:hypothetical protein